MAKTADTIAIYSRKSRYTGKGESIGNQIDLCREYIRTHYGDAASAAIVVVSTTTAGRAAEVAVERRHVIPAIIFQWKTCFSCSNPPVHLIQ